MSLLKVTDLVVSYGGIEALKGISFDVEQGQIVTLIGANGAGKSTTLRTISGLVPPKEGRIYSACCSDMQGSAGSAGTVEIMAKQFYPDKFK